MPGNHAISPKYPFFHCLLSGFFLLATWFSFRLCLLWHTARKDRRSHGLAEVLRSAQQKKARAFQPHTGSSQALSVWGIAEATGANTTLILLITLNGAMLGGSFLFETLMWGGQESMKRSIIKVLSWLEILPLFISWSQTFSCKIPKDTSL